MSLSIWDRREQSGKDHLQGRWLSSYSDSHAMEPNTGFKTYIES